MEDREHLQGAGFTENEFSSFNGEALPAWCADPVVSSADRSANATRGIVPDVKLTAAEEAYFASRGADVTGMLLEHGRNPAADGTIGYMTFDGRALSGRDFVNGFGRGDIVRLKAGGPRMVVEGAFRRDFRAVRCQWFVGGDLRSDDFEAETLVYLGPREALLPETPITSLGEHREALIRRGHQAATAKPRRVRKILRRAA